MSTAASTLPSQETAPPSIPVSPSKTPPPPTDVSKSVIAEIMEHDGGGLFRSSVPEPPTPSAPAEPKRRKDKSTAAASAASPAPSALVEEPEPVAAEPATQTAAPDPTAAAAPIPAGDPPIPQVDLEAIAEEEGLDLANPADKAYAERLYRREQRLTSQYPLSSAGGEEHLTALEKSILAKAKESAAAPSAAATATPPASPAATQPAATAAPAAPAAEASTVPASPPAPPAPLGYPKLGDEFDEWNSHMDGFKAEIAESDRIADAVSKGVTPDYSRYEAIRRAQASRYAAEFFAGKVVPLIRSVLGDSIRQQLGPVAQTIDGIQRYVNESSAHQLLSQAQSVAIEELEKIPAYKNVRQYLAVKPVAEGAEPLRDSQGRFLANNELNRIFAAHPELTDIVRQHDDPYVAAQLTIIARYRAAMDMLNARRLRGPAAQRLLDAGRKEAERRRSETQTQAALTAPGASPNGAASPSNGIASVVGEIAASEAGPKFGDLFR